MQKLSFALASCITVLSAGTRIAAAEQVEPPPDQPPPDTQPVAPDPNQPPAPTVGGDPLAAWPQRIIDRPLTITRGLMRAQADVGIARINADGGGGVTSVGMTATASYGVTDQFELGASYSLALSEFNAEGPIKAFAQYKIAEGRFKAAITGSLTYDLSTEFGVLGLGVAAQWNLGPNIALLFGGDQLRSTVIIPNGGGNQVTTVALPIGVGFQATPALFLYAQTAVATVSLQNSDSVVFGRDGEPLTLGLFYSPSNEIDLGLAIVYPNLETAADQFTILLTGRLFIAN